jgi:hypothetical protein
MVIALFDDGLIASTSKGVLDGKRLGTQHFGQDAWSAMY